MDLSMIFKPAQFAHASSYRFFCCVLLCCCIPFSQKFFLNHLKTLQGHSTLSASHWVHKCLLMSAQALKTKSLFSLVWNAFTETNSLGKWNCWNVSTLLCLWKREDRLICMQWLFLRLLFRLVTLKYKQWLAKCHKTLIMQKFCSVKHEVHTVH